MTPGHASLPCDIWTGPGVASQMFCLDISHAGIVEISGMSDAWLVAMLRAMGNHQREEQLRAFLAEYPTDLQRKIREMEEVSWHKQPASVWSGKSMCF